MSIFKEQVKFIHNQLIFLVEQKKLNFTAAGEVLRDTFCAQKISDLLPADTLAAGLSLTISPLVIEIACEKVRMALADELVEKHQIKPDSALLTVSLCSSSVAKIVNEGIAKKLPLHHISRNLLNQGGLRLADLNPLHLQVLDYYLIRYKLSGDQALATINNLSFDEVYNLATLINLHLPAILDISAGMMKEYNISFAVALQRMVEVLDEQPSFENWKPINPPTFIKQIAAAKLVLQDLYALFPGSFDAAHPVMEHYISQQANQTASTVFKIEETSLQLIQQMGWNEQQAQEIYNKLNTMQVRDLPNALHYGIPTYVNTAEYLLTLGLTLKEAHEEIVRIATYRHSGAKYTIAYEDNDYSANIKDSGLALWHIEVLLHDKKIKEIYTDKFRNENRQKSEAAKKAAFDNTNNKITFEYHHTRNLYFANIINLAEFKLGFSNVSATNFPDQFSENVIAEIPAVATSVIDILKNLTIHTMYLYNKSLDDSLNMIWKVSTNRFRPENNYMFYSTVTRVTIEEWYFQMLGDKIREEITLAAAAIEPKLTMFTNTPMIAMTFGNEIAKSEADMRSARYQESIDRLIEAGFPQETAQNMVQTQLTQQQVFLVPYLLKLKIPVVKEVMKSIITIDPSLKSYPDALAQMKRIIERNYDHTGNRLYYELLVQDQKIQDWHLPLISEAEQVKLFEEARISAQDYQSQLGNQLTNIDDVSVNHTNRLYPSRPNGALIHRPVATYTTPVAAAPSTNTIALQTSYTRYSQSFINARMTSLDLTILAGIGLTGIACFIVSAFTSPHLRLGVFGRCFRRRKPDNKETQPLLDSSKHMSHKV